MMKDPAAKLDYLFDWSAWLADGETITASTVTAPAGITITSQPRTTSGVTAWLAGGTAGESYAVTCHITTSQGREDERTRRIDVRDR